MKSFASKPWMLPQPVLIIGTYDKDGNPNAMNAAWGGQWDMLADIVYRHFYGDMKATTFDYVRYLHELPEFNVYYSRMQNVRLNLQEIDKAMLGELDSCKNILDIND